MLTDGDPPGNSFISCPPPFKPLEKNRVGEWGLEEKKYQTNTQKMKRTFNKLVVGKAAFRG